MTRRDFLKTNAAAASVTKSAAAADRPNIVVILADDMGFSDIGCYGGEIRTPNIDSLARNGLRFTQFYNTARCCPTRASLLTGLYPHQAGVGHMVDNPKPFPGYRGDLSQNCVTIAEVLRAEGYGTYMSGKWHVTPVTESKHNWPLQRGFDRYYGIIHGASSYFDPVTLTRDNDPVEPGENYYFTDAIADNAVQFIKSGAAARKPFFLYTAFTAPHWPLHAKPDDIARYRGRYNGGWDALREARHKRQIELGLVRREWPITRRDPSVAEWAAAENKEWQARRMEVYAAQVDSLDQNVGRILEALKASGQERNTLVVFLADNGGCAEELGPRAGGLHVPNQTRQGEAVRRGNSPAISPGDATTYASYGVPWANASNTPFRLYKHWVHEGGISTPLVACWPGEIKPGTITHQPGHLIDLMATCVSVSGAKYPDSRKGQPVQPMEGVSLQPAFRGGNVTRSNPIFWEHEGNLAIRDGQWKLVLRHPGTWELYDLHTDRTETTDLAGKHPERVKTMAAAWDNWARRAGVEPWDKVRQAPRTPAPIPAA